MFNFLRKMSEDYQKTNKQTKLKHDTNTNADTIVNFYNFLLLFYFKEAEI